MQDEHRPCAFADDEVTLPMAGLAAAFNGLRTIMDRRSILDGVARGSGATRATAFVATRQITPQGLGLLCGPIDEGVDCLAADGPQPRFVPGFQPAGDLLGRPSVSRRRSAPITTRQAADHHRAMAFKAFATACNSLALRALRSVPFGKYWRRKTMKVRPFVTVLSTHSV